MTDSTKQLTLTRTQYRPDGIFGVLTDEEGAQLAVTIEHSYNGVPKIPVGVYPCVRRRSPHFGYDVFLLQGVPWHDYIEIHIGNFNHDSDGCICLGRVITDSPTGRMVTNSNDTFTQFMLACEGCDTIILTVLDAPHG